jgi:hypothetical protein
MTPQLHQIDFYFFRLDSFYKVTCIAFEDNTYSILIFEVDANKNIVGKCISAFDWHTEPARIDAQNFLHKTFSHAQPNDQN